VKRYSSPRVVTLDKVAVSDGAKVIGTVEVEGSGKNSGVNGSTDVTATEGTGSYTTDAMSIGSKTPQSIRETPQSVTVITQQQMKDQNLTDLTAVMKQTPGVFVATDPGSGNALFYSRGYQITNFMVDGSPMAANPFPNFVQPGLDPSLAEYDHVEVLRGPDGMFAGNGDPGGTVALTRKKPLDHTQVLFEGAAGSWENYRGMVDMSGVVPDTNGKARVRIVMEDQQQDFFYRISKAAHQKIYGTVDVDLTPLTLLNFGGSYNRQTGTPWTQGLPRQADGADLGLPRDTCFCMPWNSTHSEAKEVFASLTQKIGPDWKVKLNMTDKSTVTEDQYGYFIAATRGIFPGMANVGTFSAQQIYYPLQQLSVDANLAGKFSLLGREHTLVVGADTTRSSTTGEATYNSTGSSAILSYAQLMNYDPNFYALPKFYKANYYPLSQQDQYGLYSTVKLALLDSVHLSMGARDGSYGYNTATQILLPTTGAVFSTTINRYQKSGTITPYGGLVWDMNKEWSLYGSYTDIFKVQQNIDRTGTLLPPITGSSYEAGTKAELLDNKLKFSLAFYTSERYGVAVSDGTAIVNGTSAAVYVGAGKSSSKGIDTELTGQLLPGWQLITSYVYNKNETLAGGITSAPNGAPVLTLFPQHMFKLWSTYQLPGQFDKWTVGAGVNWQSASYTSGNVCLGTLVTGNVCKDPANLATTIALQPFAFTQAPYAVVNASLAYKFDAHWEATLNVNNIFDKVYYATAGGISSGNFYGTPRNAMLTLRGSW